MITRLEVDGFKSLRSFALDLEPFTALVGPNGAGKSNVLEAIELLSRLGGARPEDALARGRGRASDQFSRHRGALAAKIAIAVETLTPHRHDERPWAMRRRYQATLSRVPVAAGVEHVDLSEKSSIMAPGEDTWIRAHPEWSQMVPDITVYAHYEPEEPFPSPMVGLVALHGVNLRDSSDRIDSGRLAPDASNLAGVLAALSERALAAVRAEFAALVPGVADFEVVERDEGYRLDFRMIDGEVVPARLASAGTSRVLALLAAIHSARGRSSVICIEEPENGLSPGRLRRLIDLLREATDSSRWRTEGAEHPPPQIIVTSHSPVLLSALREHPQHLRYVDTVRRGGPRATRARVVGEPNGADAGRTTVSLREVAAVLEEGPHHEDDR